jgi:hypothetical protein
MTIDTADKGQWDRVLLSLLACTYQESQVVTVETIKGFVTVHGQLVMVRVVG